MCEGKRGRGSTVCGSAGWICGGCMQLRVLASSAHGEHRATCATQGWPREDKVLHGVKSLLGQRRVFQRRVFQSERRAVASPR